MKRLSLSIVTPSYNQGQFIRETIESVLTQSYSPIEYLVMDGGSTDETVSILKSYDGVIQWVSEPDGGQAAAVNKGIERASGDIIGWINSDDIYYPGAFETVMNAFESHPDWNVIYGHADHINLDGSYREEYYTEKWNYDRLKEICFLCQPAVFFRKKTVKEYGLLNPKWQFAMDYDLWLRMGKGEIFHFINKKLAGSRLYDENKTLGSVGKVHTDIMDVLMEDLGYVPDTWIEGSAHSVARSEGFNQETPLQYHWYKMRVLSLISSYVNKYHKNEEDSLDGYPYRYQPFNIGIDISATLELSAAGVPFYSACLTEALVDIPTSNNFIMYSAFYNRYPLNMGEGVTVKRRNVKKLFTPLKMSDCERLQSAFNHSDPEPLMKLLNYPDVVLCPSFAFNVNLAKEVATVYVLYDLSFLEHPEYSTKANHENCFEGVFNAAVYADLFLAISEHTKQVFLKYFPHVESDRIIVIPAESRKSLTESIDRRKELQSLMINPDKPFWLCVGTVEPRKNLVSLVRAYAALSEECNTYPLFIAGGKGWLNSEIYKEVERLGLQESVIFLGYVSEQQLAALYQSCYATIYPSYYEGFGLPVLEAMSAGAAVICSNATSIPEVGGDAVVYIDPYDEKSIVDAMKMLQEKPDKCKEYAIRGKQRSEKEFSWERCAELSYKNIYRAIIHFCEKSVKTRTEAKL